MSRLRQTLAASLLALSSAAAGCAHCTTCDDFPAPAHPTGHSMPMSTYPVTMSPMSSDPGTSSRMDASVTAPPAIEADMDARDPSPPVPALPNVNP